MEHAGAIIRKMLDHRRLTYDVEERFFGNRFQITVPLT